MADLPGRPGPVAGLWQWRHRGACRDADPELFFPPDGERGPARQRRQQAAVAVCAGCPVRAQCRAYALAVSEPYGVWGGPVRDRPRRDPRPAGRRPAGRPDRARTAMTSAAYAVRDQRCAPAWSHALWLAAAQRAIEQATLRIDAESALRALVDLLGRPATSPAPLLTRPGWAALMAGTGRRRSWLASRLAWLHARGLLTAVDHGSAAGIRMLPPPPGTGHCRTTVYLLTIPLAPPGVRTSAEE